MCIQCVWQSPGPSTSLRMTQFCSRVTFWTPNIDGCATAHGACVPHLLCPLLCRRPFGLLLCPGYCEQCCSEHWGACIFKLWFSRSVCPGVWLLGRMVLFLVLQGTFMLFSIEVVSIYIPSKRLPFCHSFSSTYCSYFLMMAILPGVRWGLVV